MIEKDISRAWGRLLNAAGVTLGILLTFVAIPSWAEDDDGGTDFSLTLEAGGTYDSNVTVEQLDVATRAGDIMANFGLRLDVENSFGKNASFDLGYRFSQSLHDDFPNFDIQSHTASASLSNKFGGATVAADYSFITMKLGGSSFLDMHILSPNISGFVAKNVYMRGAYSYYRKDFQQLTAVARDSNTHVFNLDSFYFFNQSSSYFSAGISYEDENAAGKLVGGVLSDEFSLTGFALKAALQMPVMLIHKDSRIKFSYAYRDRDYDNVTASIAAIRKETRSTFRVNFKVPVYENAELTAEYKYADRNSNFPASNYTENVISFGLAYVF